ncbi:MAG: hypothetical protein HQL08_12355 [Nitrospirae bacterium]|nr:hypothetical protein [Nitrospirota bacterium]
MTSNPLSGSYSNVRSDFSNFRTQLSALQSAVNSGNQDQVNSSKSTFSTTLSQVINDLSTVNQAQPAASTGTVQSVGNSSGMNGLQNDLQTLQNALNSVGGSQGSSSSLANALSKVQSDMDSIQKGHHHAQRHSGTFVHSGGKTTGSDTLTALAALFGNGGQNQTNVSGVNIQA